MLHYIFHFSRITMAACLQWSRISNYETIVVDDGVIPLFCYNYHPLLYTLRLRLLQTVANYVINNSKHQSRSLQKMQGRKLQKKNEEV